MALVGEVGRNGFVLYRPGGLETKVDLANDLVGILNTFTGFNAIAGFDENGQPISGTVILKTNPGVHASFAPTAVSGISGQLLAQLIDQNNPGVTNQSASTAFFITSGSGGGTIDVSAPLHSDGTGSVDLTSGTVAWAGTAVGTASGVVAAINANTITTGYTAKLGTGNNANQVIIYAPQAWGALINTFNVTVTQVNITTALVVVPLSATMTPSAPVVKYKGGVGVGVVTLNVIGLVGTPTFVWSDLNPSSPQMAFPALAGIPTSISLTQGNSSCTITASPGSFRGFPSFFTGTFTLQCVITDGGNGNQFTVSCTVAIANF